MQHEVTAAPIRAMRAFSILGRIGGDATAGGDLITVRFLYLSVSSVGSEAMQQSRFGVCIIPPLWYFQYPRSDRRRCNRLAAGQGCPPDQLSVSSVGSEAMQLPARGRPLPAPGAFQYPRSDRRRCNSVTPYAALMLWFILSVSSVGSEAMQPAPDLYVVPGDVHFQYPRSDRRRCNAISPKTWYRIHRPFSILGRIGGDATTPDPRAPPFPPAFSILGRIGGDATCLQNNSNSNKQTTFQYPRSDRRRCNTVPVPAPETRAMLSVSSVGSEAMQRPCPSSHPHGQRIFQYPRSDRRRCNSVPQYVEGARGKATFSILGRIGGDATSSPGEGQ